MAVFNPFWILDSRSLNLSALFDSPYETVFLRRILVLEGLAWSHGLAVAYSGHLRGIMGNKAKLELVQPMLGEFQSHRVHMLSLLQALQPAIWTRALIIVLQVRRCLFGFHIRANASRPRTMIKYFIFSITHTHVGHRLAGLLQHLPRLPAHVPRHRRVHWRPGHPAL